MVYMGTLRYTGTEDAYWIECSEYTAHKQFNDPILYII